MDASGSATLHYPRLPNPRKAGWMHRVPQPCMPLVAEPARGGVTARGSLTPPGLVAEPCGDGIRMERVTQPGPGFLVAEADWGSCGSCGSDNCEKWPNYSNEVSAWVPQPPGVAEPWRIDTLLQCARYHQLLSSYCFPTAVISNNLCVIYIYTYIYIYIDCQVECCNC